MALEVVNTIIGVGGLQALPPPTGTASAPQAPLVAVWESLQVISMPGWEMPSSGPITWAMPWRA